MKFVCIGILQQPIQPRTQGLTYGKDPGWGWSRDFTKIDWLRGEGEYQIACFHKKRYTSITRSGQSDLNYISSFLRYMVRNAC